MENRDGDATQGPDGSTSSVAVSSSAAPLVTTSGQQQPADGKVTAMENDFQQPTIPVSVVASPPHMATSTLPTPPDASPSTCDRAMKNLGVSLPGSQAIGAGANAFSQLVRGWESFMQDQQQSDPFASMKQHMLHGLAHVPGAHRFDQDQQSQKLGKESTLSYPIVPPSFRHSLSTPPRQTIASQFLPSMLQMKSSSKTNVDDVPPPPIALDPFQRSTSTPSAFRQHSSCSTFGVANNSAFSHPLKRSAFSGIPTSTTCSEPGAVNFSSSTFGPVQFYSMALEDMERTSIEVEVGMTSSRPSKNEYSSDVGSKRGAASRAARFLSDVRVLRRKRKNRNRDGRENPTQPPSATSSASKESDNIVSSSPPMIDTAVTVITEPHFGPNKMSMFSPDSDILAIVRHQTYDSDAGVTDCDNNSVSTKAATLEQPHIQQVEIKEVDYQELGFDAEEVKYRRFETQSPPVLSQTHAACPNERSVPSVAASNGGNCDLPSPALKRQVNVSRSTKARFTFGDSPSPNGMEPGDGGSLTPRSVSSSRSSVTGSSSGHTTQATNNSSGTSNGLQSGLSTISETDREVMETNQEAKRRNLDSFLTNVSKKPENDGTSTNSGSSNSTNPNRYFSLTGSPENLREGANVPVGQLLAASSPGNRSASSSPGSHIGVHFGRGQTIGASTITSRRSAHTNATSPSATSGSISAAHTSSSGSSSARPPKFVSYVDQESSVLRGEFIEMSSSRASGHDGEAREASPAAQMLGDSDLSFEEPLTPVQARSSLLLHKRRRPPRSPGKGSRPLKTPPPRGSVSPLYHHPLSPPRDIVDHPDARNISRPHVVRSGPTLASNRSELGLSVATTSPSEHEQIMLVKERTYQERSIEIMESDIAGSAANVVTPEK